jgi:hypothetical protein
MWVLDGNAAKMANQRAHKTTIYFFRAQNLPLYRLIRLVSTLDFKAMMVEW